MMLFLMGASFGILLNALHRHVHECSAILDVLTDDPPPGDQFESYLESRLRDLAGGIVLYVVAMWLVVLMAVLF